MKIYNPKDLDKHSGSVQTYKFLLKYAKTQTEIVGLRSLLCISDIMLTRNQNQFALKFSDFIQLLGLEKKFPKKLGMKDALLIRSDTLGCIKQTDEIKLLSYVALQKILTYDCRSRESLFGGLINDISDYELDNIHPMDNMLALLHCCDNFLRQEILFKLSTCQMAIPLLLPNPHDGSVEFLLWAMRSIVKSWQGKNADGEYEAKKYRIVDYPAPIISFLRFGQLKYSKSKLINDCMSDCEVDYFFHWDCEGGDTKRLFVDGLVEMCCYLPSGKNSINDFYEDILYFVNLHGDAQHCTTQMHFINKISFMSFLLLDDKINIDEELIKVIKGLHNIPGGLVLIISDLHSFQLFKLKEHDNLLTSTCILNKKGKNIPQLRSEIRNLIVSRLLTYNKELHKTLNNYVEVAQSLNILVDETDKSCTDGKASAEKVVKLITSTPISIAKQEMLPLQGPS